MGEVVEPRLHGSPRGRGARALRAAFDERGVTLRPLETEPLALNRWLASFGRFAEREALEWLERRIAWEPRLPEAPFRELVPRLGLRPHDYQWQGAEFLARRGRALLADEMGLGKRCRP